MSQTHKVLRGAYDDLRYLLRAIEPAIDLDWALDTVEREYCLDAYQDIGRIALSLAARWRQCTLVL